MSDCILVLEINDQTNTSDCPTEDEIRHWLLSFLCKHRVETHLSIHFVTEIEIHRLNQQYRGKDKPTNVLSFPSQIPPGVPYPFLGDIIICPDVVAKEAEQQKKSLQAHWAHLLIHGTLHLLGYDHEEEQDAHMMEAYEIDILKQLAFDNPYGDSHER